MPNCSDSYEISYDFKEYRIFSGIITIAVVLPCPPFVTAQIVHLVRIEIFHFVAVNLSPKRKLQ